MVFPSSCTLSLLILLFSATGRVGSDTAEPSILFWKQPSNVFLPSDLVWPLSFKIVLLGGVMATGLRVGVQISTPHHKEDTAPKFAEFSAQHVCNATENSGQLACNALVDCRAIGLKHGFETDVTLSLKDPRGTVLSVHRMSIWIRSSVAPSGLEPPDCWRRQDPLHMQDPDCVWLWLTLNPSQNVLLSLQDLGPPEPPLTSVLGGAASLHAGTWGHLVKDFGDISPPSRLLECLPPVGFVRRELGSCAVVGSAWHLDNSHFGPEIDSHDVVLRINDAPIDGWEEHVGSKTTHRMLSDHVHWEHFNESEMLIFRLRGKPSVARFVEACHARTRQPFALSPSFVEYSHSSFAGVLERSQAFVHTTGFLGVIWALHACDRVSVYGLGGGASEQYQGMVQYNYYSWTPRNPNYFAPLHAWDDEASVLARLEQAGALRRRFRSGEEPLIRCALLGETSVKYAAAPHNMHAHSRLCRTAGGMADEAEAGTAETERGGNGKTRGVEEKVEKPRESERESAGRGAASAVGSLGGKHAALYDATYGPGGQYVGAHETVRGQGPLWTDLLEFPGPGPLFEVESGRAAVVLDAGAPMGAVVQWLRHTQKVLKVEAYGVELSRVAVESCPWPELTRQSFLTHASLDALPFPDRFFDLVYSHEVLEHVPTEAVPGALQELVRGCTRDSADKHHVGVAAVALGRRRCVHAAMVSVTVTALRRAVSRGRLFFTISLRLAGKDNPASPHLHVTVKPRGWWDDRMADLGCVPDLDLLGYMWRDPGAKHDDHPQWTVYREPWLFAYTCWTGGAEASRRAEVELTAMREATSHCYVPEANNIEGCHVDGWAELFNPDMYWQTDAAERGLLGRLHAKYLEEAFGVWL